MPTKTRTDPDLKAEPIFASLHRLFMSERGVDVLLVRPSWSPAAALKRARPDGLTMSDEELFTRCLQELASAGDQRVAANASAMHRHLRSQGYSVSDVRVRRSWNAARAEATQKNLH